MAKRNFHFRVEYTDFGKGRQWFAFADREAARRFMDQFASVMREDHPEHDLQLFAERVDGPIGKRHGVYRFGESGSLNGSEAAETSQSFLEKVIDS